MASPSASPDFSTPATASSPSTSSLSVPLSHLSLTRHKCHAYPFCERNQDAYTREPPSVDDRRPSVMDQLDEDAVMDEEEDWSMGDHKGLEDKKGPTRALCPRPALSHRPSSYSKRHASVDSPREVPLPFPLLSQQPDLSHPEATTTSPSTSGHVQGQGLQPPSQSQSFPPLLRSSSQPSTDVIDGVSLARHDQPPAYENVDTCHTGGTAQLPRSPPISHASMQSASHAYPSTMDTAADPPSPSFLASNPDVLPPSNSVGAQSQNSSETSQGTSTSVTSQSLMSSPVSPYDCHLPPHIDPIPTAAGPRDSHQDDRHSTASLPLPSHTPLHVLPAIRSGNIERSVLTSDQDIPQNTDMTLQQPHPMQGSFVAPPPPYSAHSSSGLCLMSRASSDYSYLARSHSRTSAPSEPVTTSRGLPPPAPPTILVPPENDSHAHRAPHAPFLSNGPPPPDSWIAVETFPSEYNLVVCLPGFRRDAITLSARRRRVLHLVADSWEAGGGHFERRISFGYDADLSRVRAEFDGELLRVIIPRRSPHITWYGEARD